LAPPVRLAWAFPGSPGLGLDEPPHPLLARHAAPDGLVALWLDAVIKRLANDCTLKNPSEQYFRN
jgi:hypothetical protein